MAHAVQVKTTISGEREERRRESATVHEAIGRGWIWAMAPVT
jgi:hypothetical protein